MKFILLLLTCPLLALPTSNPWDPAFQDKKARWLSLRQGFYGDYVFNRNLEAVRKTRLNTNAAYFALNVFSRAELFAGIGASHVEITTPATSFGAASEPSRLLTIDTVDHLSWLAGLKALLLHHNNYCLGAEANYFETRLPINAVINNNTGEPTYLTGQRLHYREGQVGISFSKKIPLTNCVAILPYTGVKWSQVIVEMNDLFATLLPGTTVQLFNLQEARHVGYSIGLTLLGFEQTNLTFEGRFADEKALHLNFVFSF